MSKENLFTKSLIEDLKLWKEEVGASYDDIADILKCSKGYLWDFCRKKNRISYEFGKTIEGLILWNENTFAIWKNAKRKRKLNKELKQDD